VEATVTHSLELIKGRRDRAQEENIAATMILNAVAEGMKIDERLPLATFDNEQMETTRTNAPQPWQELLSGQVQAVRHPASQSTSAARGIFSGAFNPLHEGHLRMAEIAAKRLGVPVQFELSIENVDKPPLDYTEMEQRLAQFAQRSLPLWFTRAPTFEEKSGLFSGATFVVGADTLERIGQAKYYGSAAAAETAFANIAKRGCRFLVFGRKLKGDFKTRQELAIPESLRRLCDEVPEAEFREDISSTELRPSASDD
jgi:nicotinic acid mononucleotide adenylyltransferase